MGDDHSTDAPGGVFYRAYTQHVGLVSADVTRGEMVSEIKMTLVLLDGVWLDDQLSQYSFSFTTDYRAPLKSPDGAIAWNTSGAAYVLPVFTIPGPISNADGYHNAMISSWEGYKNIRVKPSETSGNMVESGDSLVINVKDRKVYAQNAGTNLLQYVNSPSKVFDGLSGGFSHWITSSHAGTVKFYSYYRGINY